MGNGVRTTFIKNDKFKTSMVGVFFSTPLKKGRCAANALVPAILRRGTNTYPTMKAISKKLESLYGAKFDCGVSKKGENQIIRFYGECVNSKFINNEENTLTAITELIKNIIFNPILEGGRFNSEYIEQEKKQVKDIIEARKNDKVHYALERCYELMFDGEDFGLCEFGTPEEIDNTTGEDLINVYHDMLENYQVDIVISGDLTNEEFEKVAREFDFKDRKSLEIKSPETFEVEKVREFTEKFDINQGKLSMGYRVNIDFDSDEYFAMLVYNGVLGSGVQSKLFQNVREKYSLAYYAFSRFDKFKSIMGISCGIETENYEKARETILEQVEDMRKGNITKYEYETTLKSIENSLNSMKDEQAQLLDFYYGQTLCGKQMTLESIVENVKKVKIKDVVDVAKKIELDTVYFLTGKEAQE